MVKDTVFITIGVEFSNIAMAERICVLVDENETPVQVAKKIRKEFAERPFHHGWSIDTKPFKPSVLFYAIYEDAKIEKPFAHSENTPKKFLNMVEE